jgi:hypothetical protein
MSPTTSSRMAMAAFAAVALASLPSPSSSPDTGPVPRWVREGKRRPSKNRGRRK